MADLFPITIDEEIACVRREIKMREQVYPRRVADKRMTQAKADHELAAMREVLKTLQIMAGKGKLQGSKPLILFFPTPEARQEFIHAIHEARPGMVETEIFDS